MIPVKDGMQTLCTHGRGGNKTSIPGIVKQMCPSTTAIVLFNKTVMFDKLFGCMNNWAGFQSKSQKISVCTESV